MRVLFEHGAFTSADTEATAKMLAALALGLPAYVIIKVLHPSFFAREDTKTPMIFAAHLHGGECRAESHVCSWLIGGTGIAIAAMLSGWINVALLVLELKRRGEFALDSQFRRALLGILLATLCMGIAVFGIERLLDPYFAPSNGIAIAGGGPLRSRGKRASRLSRERRAVGRRQMAQAFQGHQGLGGWRKPPASSMLQCNRGEVGSITMQGRPRRSVLYMPGSNERALEKAKAIPADALIFDLEDAVAPDAKPFARARVCAAVKGGGYGGREVVIRVNALETPWGTDDLIAACDAAPDAILVPKVVHSGDIISVAKILQGVHAPEKIRLWAMMETPMAILNARTIAATAVHEENRLCCLVMGTNDLIKESRARDLHDRFAVVPWLAMTLVAARAYRLDIIDGVYNEFRDEQGLREECERGRTLGMDGKTLIHPSQVGPCNEIFSPTRGRGRLVAQGDRRLRPDREREQGRDRGRGPHGRAAAFLHGPAHRPDRRADPRDGEGLRVTHCWLVSNLTPIPGRGCRHFQLARSTTSLDDRGQAAKITTVLRAASPH